MVVISVFPLQVFAEDSATPAIEGAESVESWMPDENLRKAVARHLSTGTNPVQPEDITKEAMANLGMLNFGHLIPENTVVDFTGMEHAGEIATLDTTWIIATNIPTLRLTDNCTVRARPNVLPHLEKMGSVYSLVIKGANNSGLSSAELAGIGEQINRLAPTNILSVYTTDMADFFTLGVTVDVGRGTFTSEDSLTNPIQLPAVTVTEEYTEAVYYTQDILKGINGHSLTSNGGRANLDVHYFDENMNQMASYQNYSLTDDGIILPDIDTTYHKYVEFKFEIFVRTVNEPMYQLRAIAPIQQSTPPAVETGKVNVEYRDEDGNFLKETVVMEGTIGEAYATSAEEFEGYTLVGMPDNETGIYMEAEQTVTYLYEKNPVLGQVNVMYQDEDGVSLKNTVTLEGIVGEAYTTVEEEFEGYTLKETPENATGVYTEAEQTVTYVYEKNPVLGQVNVMYQDEEGNALKNTVILEGTVGEAYETSAEEFEGYTLKEMPDNATGVYTEAEQTVTYVYEKNPVLEEEDLNDSSNLSEREKPLDLTNVTTKKLPKTGTGKTSVVMPVVGCISMLITFGFLFFRRKLRRK